MKERTKIDVEGEKLAAEDHLTLAFKLRSYAKALLIKSRQANPVPTSKGQPYPNRIKPVYTDVGDAKLHGYYYAILSILAGETKLPQEAPAPGPNSSIDKVYALEVSREPWPPVEYDKNGIITNPFHIAHEALDYDTADHKCSARFPTAAEKANSSVELHVPDRGPEVTESEMLKALKDLMASLKEREEKSEDPKPTFIINEFNARREIEEIFKEDDWRNDWIDDWIDFDGEDFDIQACSPLLGVDENWEPVGTTTTPESLLKTDPPVQVKNEQVEQLDKFFTDLSESLNIFLAKRRGGE